MPKGDGAGFFDFLQCAGQFGCKNWSANQGCSNGCGQKLRDDAHRWFLDIVFFIEPVHWTLYVLRTTQQAKAV